MTAGTGEWEDGSGELRLYAFSPSRLLDGEGFFAAVSLDRAQVTEPEFLRDQHGALSAPLSSEKSLIQPLWAMMSPAYLGGRTGDNSHSCICRPSPPAVLCE